MVLDGKESMRHSGSTAGLRTDLLLDGLNRRPTQQKRELLPFSCA